MKRILITLVAGIAIFVAAFILVLQTQAGPSTQVDPPITTSVVPSQGVPVDGCPYLVPEAVVQDLVAYITATEGGAPTNIRITIAYDGADGVGRVPASSLVDFGAGSDAGAWIGLYPDFNAVSIQSPMPEKCYE